jgi:hypothetical protein
LEVLFLQLLIYSLANGLESQAFLARVFAGFPILVPAA